MMGLCGGWIKKRQNILSNEVGLAWHYNQGISGKWHIIRLIGEIVATLLAFGYCNNLSQEII